MFARITWGKTPPDRIDDFVGVVRSAAKPMERFEGYRGVVSLANRTTGAIMAGTYWASAEAMQASEELGKAARESVTTSIGGLQANDVRRLEFVIQERAVPPHAGTFARMNTVQLPPDKVDAAIELLRDEVVPAIKPLPGFQTAAVFVDRESGLFLAASVWASEAEREASAAVVAPMRTKLRQITGSEAPTTIDLYELVLADVKLGAPV